MGTFRCGLLLAASLFAGGPAFAQIATNPLPTAAPLDQPVTAQPPTLPATVTPDVDTNLPAGLATPAAAPIAPATNHVAKPKPAVPQLPTARGTLSAIDKVAMTVTLDAKGKPEVFKVSSKTRVFAESKPAMFSDAKVGDKAVIEYRNAKDKSKEALTVRLGGPGAPTVDKDKKAPAKKASIKKKKAAAPAKKSDKAVPADATSPANVINPEPIPAGVAPAPGGTTPPNP